MLTAAIIIGLILSPGFLFGIFMAIFAGKEEIQDANWNQINGFWTRVTFPLYMSVMFWPFVVIVIYNFIP